MMKSLQWRVIIKENYYDEAIGMMKNHWDKEESLGWKRVIGMKEGCMDEK
jgi:hypothetical protein